MVRPVLLTHRLGALLRIDAQRRGMRCSVAQNLHLPPAPQVDALVAPGASPDVVRLPIRFRPGATWTQTFTHPSHNAWCGALRRTGYTATPCQFAFFRCLTAGLDRGPIENTSKLNMNRGDCDGLIFA